MPHRKDCFAGFQWVQPETTLCTTFPIINIFYTTGAQNVKITAETEPETETRNCKETSAIMFEPVLY